LPQFRFRRFTVTLDGNFGISYGINPYDEIKNPGNFSTGSSLNVYAGLYLEESYMLTPNLSLFCLQGLTHYSNGNLGFPNVGLNVPTLSFGARFTPRPLPSALPQSPDPEYTRNWQLNCYLGAGMMKNSADWPIYKSIVFSPTLSKRINYVHRLGIFYEIAYNENMTNKGEFHNLKGFQIITHATGVTHDFLIERFTILMSLGVYLTNKIPTDSYVYERIGLSYEFLKNLRAGFYMKAHGIKAEYFELGLLYDLHFNRKS